MNRDLIIVIGLGVIALLCLPVLSLLMSDLTPPAIAQAFGTPTPALSPSPTGVARVYLLPFRQALAINQTEPTTRTNFLLYENGSDVFQAVGQQNNYVHLQTLDGKLSFWVASQDVSSTPPPSAEYDFSNRGKTIRLAPQTGYACLHEDAPPPVFALCQSLPNVATAKLIAKITAGSVTVYLVEIDNKNYFVPPESILTIP